MEDLHRVGGVPAVLRYMLDQGWLDGECLTVTGQHFGGQPQCPCQTWLLTPVKMCCTCAMINRSKHTGHIQILKGNLASEGAVAKITGKEGEYFHGPARDF